MDATYASTILASGIEGSGLSISAERSVDMSLPSGGDMAVPVHSVALPLSVAFTTRRKAPSGLALLSLLFSPSSLPAKGDIRLDSPTLAVEGTCLSSVDGSIRGDYVVQSWCFLGGAVE